MNLRKRVESAELAATKRNGQLLCNVFIRHDDETEEQTRTRLGIDSTAAVTFISKMDAKL